MTNSRALPHSRSRFAALLAAAALTTLSTSACTNPGAIADDTTSRMDTAAGQQHVATTGYDSATRDDADFNAKFEHVFTAVEDIEMHHVEGGDGPPLVLLHGWPQSWYAFRPIMDELAEHFTVYAVDLPGLGDSRGAPASYDKKTLARYLSGWLDQHGLQDVALAAHDLGAGVAYQLLAQDPGAVSRYVHMDYPLPGPALSARDYSTFSWHLAFQSQAEIPEMLVDDEVRDYLAAFYPYVARGGAAYGGTSTRSPFDAAQIDEFARTYERTQVLRGGFELYRTLDKDEADNRRSGPVRVPTMLMSAKGSMDSMRATTEPLLPNVKRVLEVPATGHWLPEENPQAVTRALIDFLR
jgi:pimeloyl-ACP methyl ester carboxylesterase